MPTSYKEILTKMGGLCLGSTVGSAIGAKILNDAGYGDYSASVSAGEGALGGVIFGAASAVVGSCIRNPDLAGKFYRYSGVPLVLLSGVLGHAILEASHEWASREAIAASATGMGVSIGAGLGLCAAMLCCLRCCLSTEELKTFVRNVFNSAEAVETAGVVALRGGDPLAALTLDNTTDHGTFTPLTDDSSTASFSTSTSSSSFSSRV